MKPIIRLFPILLFLINGCLSSWGEITVTARMDSVNLLMGNITPLYLQVVEPENVKGKFEIFENSDRSSDYVTVCGDSVELRKNYTVDTTRIGSGRLQLDYKIMMQAFDSGTYRLPEFIYIAGNDTAQSNHLTFNVIPVKVTEDEPIDGFSNVEEPEGKRFYDFVPDWILDFWWIFIIILILIILSLWALRRYRKVGTILLPPKVLTPYEIAMQSLISLKEKKLWEQGQEKEYFTELTDILRTYLMNRFGINALEMTTSQIMEKIKESEYSDKKSYVNDILKMADFVKFAKVRPVAEDNITAYDNAVRFVEETREAPREDESENDDEFVDIEQDLDE